MKIDKEIIQNFFQNIIKECHKLESEIDFVSLIEAKKIIMECKRKNNRIHITGIGKPSYVAGYIASLFSSIGIPAYKLDGTEAVHGSAGQVEQGDVVIAISNSGQTKELLYTITTLIKNGARIIAVTGNVDSWLGKHCDICIKAAVEQEGDKLNLAPRNSILKEIILLQSLSILLQNEIHLSIEDYVKWHPGGELGKKLEK